MDIKFIKADRMSTHSVLATYSLDGVKFGVEWNNVNPKTGEIEKDYDLQIRTVSDDYDLAQRVDDAIREGETDANPDLELYLFVRDTFHSGECLEI